MGLGFFGVLFCFVCLFFVFVLRVSLVPPFGSMPSDPCFVFISVNLSVCRTPKLLLHRPTLKRIYATFIRHILKYVLVVWDG